MKKTTKTVKRDTWHDINYGKKEKSSGFVYLDGLWCNVKNIAYIEPLGRYDSGLVSLHFTGGEYREVDVNVEDIILRIARSKHYESIRHSGFVRLGNIWVNPDSITYLDNAGFKNDGWSSVINFAGCGKLEIDIGIEDVVMRISSTRHGKEVA